MTQVYSLFPITIIPYWQYTKTRTIVARLYALIHASLDCSLADGRKPTFLKCRQYFISLNSRLKKRDCKDAFVKDDAKKLTVNSDHSLYKNMILGQRLHCR